MQELISQVEELGIEINHTTSLVMIFGIIFLTAIIVHVILHWVVLRAFEKTRQYQFPSVVANYHTEQIIPPPGVYAARYHRQYTGYTLATKRQ